MQVDGTPYVGSYDGIAVKLIVAQEGSGLTLTSVSKFKYYETVSIEPVTIKLLPAGDGMFVVGANAEGGVVKFVNPDSHGKTQHLATGGRLVKRSTRL